VLKKNLIGKLTIKGGLAERAGVSLRSSLLGLSFFEDLLLLNGSNGLVKLTSLLPGCGAEYGFS